MDTIGHHTCRRDGGKEYILCEAPFEATHDPGNPNNPTYQFLGTGHYFWDDDIQQAHWWGQMMLRVPYFIVECDLIIPPEHALDLVGSRRDMKTLEDLIDGLKNKGLLERYEYNLSTIIEYYKEMYRMVGKPFPYWAIRAHDMGAGLDVKSRYFFVNGRKNYISLRPRYVICLINKKDVSLRPRIINK